MSIRSWLSILLLAVALPASAEITISTFAGVPAERRQIDGPSAVAQFLSTRGIASDGAGNFYLNDTRTVRRIDAGGSVATAAGRPEIFSGPHSGFGADVFVEPHNYVAYGGGYVFFALGNLAATIQRLDVATGLVIEYAGVGFGFQDGASAQFRNIRGMVVGPDGTLYLADMSNHVIRKITTDRNTTTYAGLPMNGGFADGSGTTVRFNTPTDVTIDSAGNVYVTDYANQRIRKITPAGVVSTFAGNGNCPRTDGTGTGACFNGDARVDLLWRNTSAFTQEIWTLNGSGATVFTLPGSSARPRLAHDFDGDGDPDIVFESPYAIWTMNGTTMTSGAFLPGVSDANMRLAGAARIGNDPRGTLLWRNIVSGENALWYINPGGTISGMYMPPVPDSNWDIIGPR